MQHEQPKATGECLSGVEPGGSSAAGLVGRGECSSGCVERGERSSGFTESWQERLAENMSHFLGPPNARQLAHELHAFLVSGLSIQVCM